MAITAALLTLALVATHVATKASTPTEAATALPSVSTSTPPPSVDSSATTVPDASADGAGSDVVVPSLPGAPPAPSADCPAGKVTAVVSQVQAQQSPSDPTGWDVIVRGTLTNGTATPIVAPTVKVTITTSSGDEPAYGDTTNGDLAAGQSVDWSANSYVSSSTKPTATAQPDRWAWADPKYGECPSSGDQGASTAR